MNKSYLFIFSYFCMQTAFSMRVPCFKDTRKNSPLNDIQQCFYRRIQRQFWVESQRKGAESMSSEDLTPFQDIQLTSGSSYYAYFHEAGPVRCVYLHRIAQGQALISELDGLSKVVPLGSLYILASKVDSVEE